MKYAKFASRCIYENSLKTKSMKVKEFVSTLSDVDKLIKKSHTFLLKSIMYISTKAFGPID